MATVLLTWEMGSGIGHLMNLRPIGQELVRRGHRVIAALKDLSKVKELYAGTGIMAVQAPLHPPSNRKRVESTMGYADFLANVGFGEERTLRTIVAAWDSLIGGVKPDLVVADYSPGALFALRGTPIRKVNVGLGFFCPPDGFPLPHWLPKNLMAYHPRLIQKEHRLTQLANKILSDRHRPPLQRLSRIHNDVDEVFLATYPEFDHFGERPGMRYWGHWPFGIGIDPIWPAGNGPKIYCYLKPFPALEALLAHLRHRGTPTIVFAGGIDPKVQAQFSSPSMRFENSPLDLCKVTTQCDVAITHAGHGTTVSFLLAGKPCVVVPRFVEQGLFAERIERTGVGRMVVIRERLRFARAFDELLGDGKYRASAQTFAAKYAGFTPGGQIPELTDRLERLLSLPDTSSPSK